MYVSKKGVILFLSYAYLVYEFLTRGSHSGFIFLFGIQIELLFLLLSYVLIPLIRKGVLFPGNSFNVLLGAAPIAIINYFIAFRVAMKFDGLEISQPFDSENVFAPIIFYQDTIVVLIVGFALAYGVEIYDFIRSKRELSEVAESIVYQGIVLWVMGMLGGVLLFFVPSDWIIIIVILFSSSRIGLELLLNKWRMKNH